MAEPPLEGVEGVVLGPRQFHWVVLLGRLVDGTHLPSMMMWDIDWNLGLSGADDAFQK